MSGFPGLNVSERQGLIFVRCQPVAGRPRLGMEALKSCLSQAGLDGWFLFDDAVATLIERCNEETPSEGDFEMRIGERRDASFELEISRDAMCAWMTPVPAYGGRALTPADLRRALNGAGVVVGIDDAALATACEPACSDRVTVAKGQPSQPGVDTVFELLAQVTQDRVPKVDEQGLMDYRDQGAIPMVDAGQALMRRTPPTAGVVGCDIRGEVLPALRGKDEPFPAQLPGSALSPGDPNLLVAAVKGQPVRVGNGVLVEQVVHFSGATIASGNITFDGTVQIDGDVQSGMKVEATGDILISGTVDGGILIAGGNVQVGGGIIAQTKVQAQGSVSARFVENSSIECGAGIAINDMALQSKLQAGHQIIVGIMSPKRGRLVGGSARAMMLVRAPLLGDPASSVTQVLVGVNPVLEGRYRQLGGEIDKQIEVANNIQKVINHLSRHGDPNGMKSRALATWEQVIIVLTSLVAEKDDLKEKMILSQNARVDVGVGVMGAVDLSFGRTTRSLRRNYDDGSFSMEGDRIVFTPKDGNALDVN